MLTREQNELLTQTGPGTPGGKLLRSYWQPVAAAEEIPVGGSPLPVRILGEDLVLFRDEQGRLGLIQQFCPHRGTDLSYGRIENGGLRCLYHGWLFGIDGKCLEQPAEKSGAKFCDRVRATAYPVQEKGGAVWAFMGEGEPPQIPDFEFLIAPEPNRIAFRTIAVCNWLQGLESVIDPVHTTYLHRRPPGTRSIRSGNDVAAMRGTEPPKIETENTDLGIRIYVLHEPAGGAKYLRINNYVYPCGATPTTGNARAGYQGRWIVPRDDISHYMFEFIYRRYEPLDKDTLRKFRAENVAADGRHVRRPENRYLQDREEMKRGASFCGMGDYFPAQDAFAIETQGAVRDRTKENLGSSDVVITSVRRTLLKAIEQVQAGNEAPGLIRGNPKDVMANFVCFEGPIGDDEDPRAYGRRIMATIAAAE